MAYNTMSMNMTKTYSTPTLGEYINTEKQRPLFEKKEEYVKKLQRTSACRHVTTRKEDGSYGVCYRQVCTFAHSLEEFRVRECNFDTNCRNIFGRPLPNGRNDPTNPCKFKHSFETLDEWILRTKSIKPDLPSTNEFSRIIPEKKEVVEKSVEKVVEKSDFPPLTDEPCSQPTVTKEEKEEDEDDEEEEEEDEEKSDQHIIRVPTEELAKFALKTLFEKNVFNVKVIIEA